MEFTYQILYEAWRQTVTLNSTEYNKVKYRYYLESNLGSLLSILEEGSFEPSPLRNMVIIYPKRRIAQVPNITDKIVQHTMYDNGLYQMLTKPLINGTSACILHRGDDYASAFLKKMLVNYRNTYGTSFYCLKCDIKSYFATIPHDRVFNLLNRYITDPDFKSLASKFINQSPVGLALGLPQSQAIANLYLSGLDHFCKEQLHAKYYARHMDDFYIISNSYQYLERCQYQIQLYVESIGLKLNPKTCIYKNKVEFLGFKYFFNDTGKIIMRLLPDKRRSKRRELKKKLNEVKSGERTPEEFIKSYSGWRVHALRGNCYSLVRAWDSWLITEFAQLGYKLRFHKRSVYLCREHLDNCSLEPSLPWSTTDS